MIIWILLKSFETVDLKNFNPEKPSKFIQYLDANNLYGWAMSKKLPTHDLKWLSKSNTFKLEEKNKK